MALPVLDSELNLSSFKIKSSTTFLLAKYTLDPSFDWLKSPALYKVSGDRLLMMPPNLLLNLIFNCSALRQTLMFRNDPFLKHM